MSMNRHDAQSRPARQGTRRAPGPDDRQRDATRSRQRLLDAALAEFAAKGYAGATVREIARRAGVNTQLISYYFGGKEGLYHELVASWHQQEAAIEAENSSFADICIAYMRTMTARPEILKMFVWNSLTQPHPDPEDPGPARGPRGSRGPRGEAPEVADLRRRQAAGEIAADLDPRYLMIFLMGAAMVTVTMPDKIEELCGVRADSPEFLAAFEEQIPLIIAHLTGQRSGTAD
jgi:TetR/AcrR family transcriptional regulator